MVTQTTADNQDKCRRVHTLLLERYGQPQTKDQLDPLTELVQTILSQNTADINTHRSFASLRERFPTWEAVLEAPPEDVVESIRQGGLAAIKAPRIQRILRHLHDERGELSLDFLAGLSVEEARRYLTSLEGVGPKTASCVLLFSLHKPALPVDTHVHRVCGRIGLVPGKATPEQTGLLLERMLPPETYYPFHLNVIRHGRTVCRAPRPLCTLCSLADLCAHRLAENDRAVAAAKA